MTIVTSVTETDKTPGDPLPDFLAANPDIAFVDAFIADLNGVLRGKRLPRESARGLFTEGLRLPRSVVGLDIWGSDVFANGLVLETGDVDGYCLPATRAVHRAPWSDRPTAQVHMMMTDIDRGPFDADPRQALINQLSACNARDLFPVVALELEFYLLADSNDELGRPALPATTGKARRVRDGELYAMDALDRDAAFIDDLYAACALQNIPLDAAIVESGPGQFEVNLRHQANAVIAADHAVLLRRAIKGIARAHGKCASFMAKPFADLPGNGMHAHVSVVDAAGRNVFDDGGPAGSPVLHAAVAGLLASAPEAMIFLAPHANSYRRFQDASHAPTRAAWGYDNRTTAIRIPSGDGASRRYEHRIAGADANPYLVLAAILSGMLTGIDGAHVPPPPVDGNGYENDAPRLPTRWRKALKTFADGDYLPPAFGDRLTHVYTALKRQEIAVTAARITDFEYDSYLHAFG